MTPENQRAVSELLRSADKAIKEGNLDNALAAISKVFEFDPRNVYARAYQERILSLKEAQFLSRMKTEKAAAENVGSVQESSPSQQSAPPGPKETAESNPPRPSQSHEKAEAAAESAGAPTDEHTAAAAPPRPVHEHPPTAQTPVTLEIPVPPPPHPLDFMKHTPALLEAYRTLLGEIWADGMITESEQERVNSMRETFAVTEAEHTAIEREVRVEAYLSSIEKAWKKGITNFDELRRQFKISDQEHLQIEGTVFRILQSLRSVGTVLLVDDDPEFLELAGHEMREGGYYCVTVNSCEEALKVLETLTPDIVVCDVNFSKPSMSGFAFYEKFRSMERFFHVPFLFLSGMVQEAVQRTGMQMGADGYFLKPVDLELFLATIEGKIKRAHELHQRLSPHRL